MDKYIQKIMTKDGAKQIDYNALANLPMINQDDSVDVEKTINASNIVLEQSVEANSVISGTIIGTTVQGNVGEFENIYNKTDIDNKIDKINYDGLYAKGETYSGIASNKGIKLHSVKGKTSQKTTNGYQLFDTSKITNHNGITVTHEADGSFTLNGESAGNHDSYIINGYISTDIAITSGLKLKANVTNTNIRVIVGNGTVTIRDLPLSTDIQDFNASNISWVIFRVNNNTSVDNLNLKIMLYQDGDGTWEQYTGGKPAPNGDYPMEIKNVEIKNIVSFGKNIFSKISDDLYGINCTYFYNVATNELTIYATNAGARIGEIVNKNSSHEHKNGDLYMIPDSASKIYLRSENGVFDRNYVTFYDKNKISLGYANINISGVSIPESSKYLSLRIGLQNSISGTSYTDKLFISFEPISGDFLTPHYNEVQTSIKLAEGETYIDGEPTARKRKQITFDGSSDENWMQSAGLNTRYFILINDMLLATENVVCNRFGKVIQSQAVNIVGTFFVDQKKLQFVSDGITSVENWKTWLQSHPITVEYELETPTTETIKVPTVPSYNPHTNVWTDNQVPTDMEWELLANSDNSLQVEALEKKIEELQTTMLELKTKGVI